jgi:Fe-S cluster assembly protein SufD
MTSIQLLNALNMLSRETVNALAAARREPDWMRQRRLTAWDAFEKLEMPSSRYTQVRGLSLEELSLSGVAEKGPKDLPKTLDELLINRDQADGLLVHLDGQPVHTELSDELAGRGVLFMDLSRALASHPELVERYLTSLEPSDKMMALQRALCTGGVLLYVPKNVEIHLPLRAINLLTGSRTGLFQEVVIIAEPGSHVSYVEELGSLHDPLDAPSVYASATTVHVGEGAHVDVAGVQNWDPQIFSFARRQGLLQRDGHLRWALGWLGGRMTLSHLDNVLDGPGTEVEDVQIFFASGRQHFDLTSNLIHRKPHTKGEVTVKGVLKDKSNAVFWGRIRIDPGAQQANAFQSERALILNEGPRSVAIPSLEIEANDVRCTHAASSTQLDEEQVFYLKTRGFSDAEARRTIVDGFFEPTVSKIPLASSQEAIRELISRKWQSTSSAV